MIDKKQLKISDFIDKGTTARPDRPSSGTANELRIRLNVVQIMLSVRREIKIFNILLIPALFLKLKR